MNISCRKIYTPPIYIYIYKEISICLALNYELSFSIATEAQMSDNGGTKLFRYPPHNTHIRVCVRVCVCVRACACKERTQEKAACFG